MCRCHRWAARALAPSKLITIGLLEPSHGCCPIGSSCVVSVLACSVLSSVPAGPCGVAGSGLAAARAVWGWLVHHCVGGGIVAASPWRSWVGVCPRCLCVNASRCLWGHSPVWFVTITQPSSHPSSASCCCLTAVRLPWAMGWLLRDGIGRGRDRSPGVHITGARRPRAGASDHMPSEGEHGCESLLERGSRQGADDSVDLLCVADDDEQRDRLCAESCGELRIGVDVDLHDLEVPSVLFGEVVRAPGRSSGTVRTRPPRSPPRPGPRRSSLR